jgi:hypothetical protein
MVGRGDALVLRCPVTFTGACAVLLWVLWQVGYGDIYPNTPQGRCVMALLIIVMLVQVPVQINSIMAYFEPGAPCSTCPLAHCRGTRHCHLQG